MAKTNPEEKFTSVEEEARKAAKARIEARKLAKLAEQRVAKLSSPEPVKKPVGPKAEPKAKTKAKSKVKFATTRRLSQAQSSSQPKTLQSPWEPSQRATREAGERALGERFKTMGPTGEKGFFAEERGAGRSRALAQRAYRKQEAARLRGPSVPKAEKQAALVKEVAAKQPGMFKSIFGQDTKIVRGLPGVSKKDYPGFAGRQMERLGRLGRESAGAAARLGALVAVSDLAKTARQARIEGDSVGDVVGKTALRAGNAAAWGSILGTAARIPAIGRVARFAGGKLAWPIAIASAVTDVAGIAAGGYGAATVPSKTAAARRTAEKQGFKVTGGEQPGFLAGVSRLGRAFAARKPREPEIEETDITRAISRAARQRAERGGGMGYGR